MTNKPFSPSCERNKEPILKILKEVLGSEPHNLLELGSGTGQHAAFFAQELPNIQWTCSDVLGNHAGIHAWLDEAKLENLKVPVEFEIGKDDFPTGNFDVVFTANTFHIMSWEKCQQFIELCGANLSKDTLVIIYGPFNYGGDYSSESNAQFDIWLKERDSESAIRDFEAVCELMKKQGFDLENDFVMPANNRTLLFKRSSPK